MRTSPAPPGRSVALDDGARLAVLQILARCFLVAFFVARVAAPIADLDMWHEMALIRESLGAGHLLTSDVYAYTPTIHPVVDHEWGAGALLYLVVHYAGGWAVVPLKYLVVLLTGAAVFWCARLRRAGFEEFTSLAPFAIPLFAIGCATLRAQSYSFLFFAVLLCLLELDSAGERRWRAAVPLLFAVWVNMHGGCVVGLIALVVYWVEQLVRRRPHLHVLALAAASVAALIVNPYGAAYYRQLWFALRMPRPQITEWYSIAAASPFHQVLFWATLLVAAYAVFQRGWRESSGALILAAMACGAILHLRMVPFYAVAWVAYVPSYLKATPLGKLIRSLFRHRAPVTAVCLILAMFFAVMALEIGFYKIVVPNQQFPVGAVQYLKELQFQGNVMTHFEHGGYVSWWLYPPVKVSVDSRYETAFAPAVVDESFSFFNAGPGWQNILAKYPTDLVLAPIQSPIAKLLPAAGWKLVYLDQSFQVYERPDLELPFRDDSARSFATTFP